MDVHQNAKTTPFGRRLMIERLAEGWTVPVAAAAGVTARPSGNRRAGTPRRRGRPRRPLVTAASQPDRLPDAGGRDPGAPPPAPVRTRHRRRLGPRSRPWAWSCAATGSQGSALLDPKPEIIRYQRDRPGELIHLDIKKLGRIDGIGHRITGDRRGQKKGIGWKSPHAPRCRRRRAGTPSRSPSSGRAGRR